MPREKTLVEHRPVSLKDFRGLFSRGMNDAVPQNYFVDCLNIRYNHRDVYLRNGVAEDFTLPNIRRFFIYKRLNEASRYLVLDTSGNFYDSLSPGTPLITNAAFVDFSAVNYANRAYITFHNRVLGISGTNVYVYEGAGPGTLRLAAGSPPSGFTLGVADSASSGTVEAGTHLFAVAFETSSGFITAPGPEAFTAHVAAGGKKLDFSAIPVGPSGTTARRILGTKAIVDYDGNQFGYEFFFLPNGRIANNVDTTLANVDFYDADLFSTADYLFDNRSTIPAGLGLTVYQGRLVLWGVPGFEHQIFVSRRDEPEVFDDTTGLIVVDPSEAKDGVKNCIEFRKNLYIAKSNRFYVSLDNTYEPNTWSLDSVDKGAGTEIFGISRILDSRGANTDRMFVASRVGLLVFESSVFRKPEMTWNVEGIWKRINKVHFNKVQVDHDSDNYLVYVSIPLDDATECSHLLVGDYKDSMPIGFILPNLVKWTLYKYPWNISSVSIDLNSVNESVLKLSGVGGNIYIEEEGRKNDANTRIEQYVKFGGVELASGWIHHVALLQFRMIGSGNLQIDLYGEDDVENVTVRELPLTSSPGLTYARKVNFENEKCYLKISTDVNVNEWFQIYETIIHIKPIWMLRPNIA